MAEPTRRRVLHTAAAAGVASVAGCSFDVSLGSDDNATTATGRTVSWSNATKQVTSDQQMAAIRAAGIDAVDSAETAKRAFRVVGWQQAVSAVTVSDIETLTNVSGDVRSVEEALSGVRSRLAEVQGLIQRMKSASAFGQSAWDVATATTPGLSRFDDAITAFDNRLADWEQSLANVRASLGETASVLIRFKNGNRDDYTALATRVEDTKALIADVVERSSDIRRRLSEFGDLCTEVSAAADDVPVVGGQVRRVFGATATALHDAAAAIETFTSELERAQSTLTTMQSTATQTRSSLLSEARTLIG